MNKPEEGRSVVPQMLEVAVRDLSKQTGDLTEAVRHDRRWRRFAAVILVLFALQIGYDGYQQHERTRTARDTNRIVHVLEDATTPGHPGYDHAQQQTQDAIRQILVCGRAYADNASKGAPIPQVCP